jgi:cytochrome d ubiquinol oxidase subunit II
MDLNSIWFWLIAVLIIGYAILDGFDFGVGVLSLFGRDEKERRIHFNAIGPVWDGNEVWLITGGGALFAAFPIVYATVFSGFYLALMLLLTALIFRAVSFEFRNKVESPGWRRAWDFAFGFGSLLPAVLFGIAVGNILRGVPIDASGNFLGTFLGLLNPYSIGVGLLSLVLLSCNKIRR